MEEKDVLGMSNLRYNETITRSITGFFLVIFLLVILSFEKELFCYALIVATIAFLVEWFLLWYKKLLLGTRVDAIFCATGIMYIIASMYVFCSYSVSLVDRALLVLMLVASDAGAYFIGTIFGKHKIAPNISPKKTWEGLIGGVFFTTLLGMIYVYFFKELKIFWILLPLVSIVAHIGDFLESSAKRYLGIKNTSNILPGHGGLLDRFDSAFLVIPFYYGFMLSH